MIGLGETKEENHRNNGRPSCEQTSTSWQSASICSRPKKHIKVQKYYHPDEFAELKEIAMEKGFSHCEAGTARPFFIPCRRTGE
jgi:lipoic acid synthetase